MSCSASRRALMASASLLLTGATLAAPMSSMCSDEVGRLLASCTEEAWSKRYRSLFVLHGEVSETLSRRVLWRECSMMGMKSSALPYTTPVTFAALPGRITLRLGRYVSALTCYRATLRDGSSLLSRSYSRL